jgi:hypothetical protein
MKTINNLNKLCGALVILILNFMKLDMTELSVQ